MPYWQFLLHIGLLGLAARRAAGAYVLIASDAPWLLAVCLIAQAVFALLAAIAMWSRLSWQLGSVITLAVVVVVASIVQMFVLGQRTVPLFVGQAVLAAIAAVGVVTALRYADAHPEGAGSR